MTHENHLAACHWPTVATGTGSCRLCIVPTAGEQGFTHKPAIQISNLKVTLHSVSPGKILPKSDRDCESGKPVMHIRFNAVVVILYPWIIRAEFGTKGNSCRGWGQMAVILKFKC